MSTKDDACNFLLKFNKWIFGNALFTLCSRAFKFIQHVNIFPPTEWQTITESVQCMVHALEGGVSASLDQPDASPIQLGETVSTTIAGRPPSDVMA